MSRIGREKQTIEWMIRHYCHRKEGHQTLCDACRELLVYAHARLDHCTYGEGKRACRSCPTPCYKVAMREKIRQVMRFSGPRILFYSPLQALLHWFR